MIAKARSTSGSPVIQQRLSDADPGLVRHEDEVGRFDPTYVAALVLLRWAIVIAYVGIVVGGAVPMNTYALAGSAGWIAVSNVVAFWAWRQKRRVPWYDNSYLFIDSLSVVFGVLAPANLSYPIWLAFVMVMATCAAEQSTRYSALCNLWCIGAYLFCAGVLAATGWYHAETGVLVVTSLIMLFVGTNLTITFDGNRRLRAYIRRMSVTDPLTGLANRRRLTDILARDAAADRPIAVIILDVDNFKQYNDSYGHLAGDQLLVRLARTLEANFHDADAISRYGGDEFVVLLPCDSAEAAVQRANNLVGPDRPGDVPVSVGLAVWPDHEPTLDGALAAADDCLRAAKRAGKGRLVAFAGGA